MSARLHLIFALGLMAAGAALLLTAPAPGAADGSDAIWALAGFGLWSAGVGVFVALAGSAAVGLLRIRRHERTDR